MGAPTALPVPTLRVVVELARLAVSDVSRVFRIRFILNLERDFCLPPPRIVEFVVIRPVRGSPYGLESADRLALRTPNFIGWVQYEKPFDVYMMGQRQNLCQRKVE